MGFLISCACAIAHTKQRIRPHPHILWAIHKTKERIKCLTCIYLPAAICHHAAKSLHMTTFYPCANLLPRPPEPKQTPARCLSTCPKHVSTSTSSPHANRPLSPSFSSTVFKVVLLATTQWRTSSAPSRRHTSTLLDVSTRRAWAGKVVRMYRVWPASLKGLFPYCSLISASLATASAHRADAAGCHLEPRWLLRGAPSATSCRGATRFCPCLCTPAPHELQCASEGATLPPNPSIGWKDPCLPGSV